MTFQSPYIINDKYFDVVDTSDKAYWLGFIWGDGSVCKRDRGNYISYEFKLSLADTDIEHLVKFKQCLESSHPIKTYQRKWGGISNVSDEVRLLISTKHLGRTLYESYGIRAGRPDASLVLDRIPDIYYRDFIRGLVDANGSITHCPIKKYKKERKAFELILFYPEEVLSFINEQFIRRGFTQTRYKIYKRHPERDGNTWGMNIGGNNIIYSIVTWLYKDSGVYLSRKYNRYLIIDEYMRLFYKEKSGGVVLES
jgi:hypothetical protein